VAGAAVVARRVVAGGDGVPEVDEQGDVGERMRAFGAVVVVARVVITDVVVPRVIVVRRGGVVVVVVVIALGSVVIVDVCCVVVVARVVRFGSSKARGQTAAQKRCESERQERPETKRRPVSLRFHDIFLSFS
jgi:hypothetical protein